MSKTLTALDHALLDAAVKAEPLVIMNDDFLPALRAAKPLRMEITVLASPYAFRMRIRVAKKPGFRDPR